MKREKISGIAGVLFLGFLVLFAGGKQGGFAGLLMLFLVGIGALYYWKLPEELLCMLQFPATARKGEKLHGAFVINQLGRCPVFFGKAFGKGKNLMTGEESEFEITITLMGKEEGTAPIILSSNYMGCLEVTIEKIVFFGLFGIGKKERKISLKKEILILPDSKELTISLPPSRGRAGDGDEAAVSLHGYDSTLYQGVRVYREGDSMRQIHWKMTGKTEEYMVKELGEPALFMPMVFLETTVDKKQPSDLDRLMEEYISVSQWLAEQNIRHMLCWKDGKNGDWNRHLVANLGQLDSCFEILLSTGFQEGNNTTFPEALEKWEQETWWLCVMSNAGAKREMEQWDYEERTIQFINTDQRGV